jgi:2-polyprenyl-3-methyl-5-hydroxy-6-metoxy-1,4-benzoquinol methylase
MDLVIEQELENSPTITIEQINLLTDQYLEQGDITQALAMLYQALQLTPHSMHHLSRMRYLLYQEPAKAEHSPYYLLLLDYRIFDHKFIHDKVVQIIFELEKNIHPLNNPLFHAVLRCVTVISINIEKLLCQARQQILQLLLKKQVNAINLELIKSMAHQCYLNEHIWGQDPFSVQQIINLLTATNAFLTSTSTLDYYHKCVILLASSYFSLSEIVAFYPVVALACQADTDLSALYNLEIASRQYEEQLKPTIPQLTSIDQTFSSHIREQYEDYPYPRWGCVEIMPDTPLITFLENVCSNPQQVAQLQNLEQLNLAQPEILIAGSGTGSQPLQIALIKDSKITAIDLSLNSLAYAMRQTMSLNITNITYAQADLTKIEQINKQFDYIECIGVLHHTRSIENSLRKLCTAAKPFGILRLGLYSATARADLKHIKQFVKDNNYTADLNGIRKFAWALGFSDFFSTSMCIDLLFHTHEISSTIPEIKQLLRKNNLKFIGFNFPYYLKYNEIYKTTFPDDPLMNNLNNWQKLEQMYPSMFASMFCFVVQKMN